MIKKKMKESFSFNSFNLINRVMLVAGSESKYIF